MTQVNQMSNFEWNQTIIQDYLNEGQYNRLKKTPLSGSIHNLNKLDINNQTALMWAIIQNHFKIASELLNISEIDINIQNINGWTALILVCQDNPELISGFLNHPELDINQKKP